MFHLGLFVMFLTHFCTTRTTAPHYTHYISVYTIRCISPMLDSCSFFTCETWFCPGLYVFKGELFTATGSPVLRLCCVFCLLHSNLLSAFLKGFAVVPAPGLYFSVAHHISGKQLIQHILDSFFTAVDIELWLYHIKIKKGIKTCHSYLITENLNFTAKPSLETKQNKIEANTKLQAAQDSFRQRKPVRLLSSSLANSNPCDKGNNVLLGYQTTDIVKT